MATGIFRDVEGSDAIFDTTIVDAEVIAGDLVFTKHDSSTINVGPIGGGGGGGGELPEVRHDNTVTHDYTGNAPIGSSESDIVWDITRLTMTSPPVVGHATGAWTNRVALTYI